MFKDIPIAILGTKKMYFLTPIVISKKIHTNAHIKTKAFLASLILHGTILGTVLSLPLPEKVELPKEKTAILVSLSQYSPLQEQQVPTPLKQVSKNKQQVPMPLKQVQKTLKKVTKKVTKKIVKKVPLPNKKQIIETKTLQKRLAPPKKELISSEAFTPHASNETSAQKLIQNNSYSPKKNQSYLSKSQITPTTLGMIRALIQNALVYPAIARKLKIEGVVTVSFTLTQNGYVENATIHTKSGSNLLDAKALKTVLALSGEYPHLDKKVDLRIPISFSLQKP